MSPTTREPRLGSCSVTEDPRGLRAAGPSTTLRPGYVSTLSVLVLSSLMLMMVTSSFRFAMQSQSVQKQVQVRIDYTQREQALLRATLDGVANSAMRCMMANSNGSAWETENRWRWIFESARAQAQGETARDGVVSDVLGISTGAISGNTGDGAQDHIVYNVSSVVDQPSMHQFYVNAGTNTTPLALGPKYPEPLMFSDPDAEKLDRDRPLVTNQKTYADGSTYKLLPYPNVHFGYSTQGQNFVAKRNWWAFAMDYGSQSVAQTGVKTVKRNYILSLYEVPSQLGLSSTALTSVGKFSDGTSWGNNISIRGTVFTTKGLAEGGIALDQFATRRGATIASGSTVGDLSVDVSDGSLPDREEFESSNAEFYPLSSAGDSGLVAFVPINRGEDAFDDLSATTDLNRASPTSWNWYSRPAMQCAMNLRVESVYSASEQIPTEISFRYKVGGMDRIDTFEAGTNWPSKNSPEGATFPFHLEETPYGRQGIVLYTDRLEAFLSAAGADSLAVNHSILVNANYRDNADITRPNIPSLASDMCLILRGSRDISMFPKGFSLVTPLRMYLASDVNLVPTGTDAAGRPTYPPLSLFSPEKRFGIRKDPITIRVAGQINHLGKDQSALARPGDLQSGENEEVVPGNIYADLYSITTPAQIPPVNQMNWLIVLEEVQ